MVRKKSKSKTKKVSKRKTSKKSPRRNPKGEAFRQQHERRLYESRGPQIPEWLANSDSKEADATIEKIRKAWYAEMRERYAWDE